jgi:hypothetical protein
MPFKCTQCNRVTDDRDDQECQETPQRADCKWQKAALIHLLHPDGPGEKHSKKKVKVFDEATKKDRIEVIRLSLCCSTQERIPTATPSAEVVTCAECLAFAESEGLFETEEAN